ncbi:MAG: GTP 3',8-cyclase MoaA [Candidatus Latescibacterota bacterium]|nr:MAG: GTP 3',8-cyclase MoaA [Candidatus Latescibacterota bacterium]
MKDTYGREIDCLRISTTDRCDLRCVYCMPARGARFVPHAELLAIDEIVEVVRFLAEHAGLRRVRITGGEPLVRPDLPDLVEKLAALPLEDLALTTNGQLLAPKAELLKSLGLRRVNISIDSLERERFRSVVRGGELDRTLDGIAAADAAGLRPIKLNVVLLKGMNEEEIVDLVRYGLEREVEVRFLELMSIGVAASFHEARFLSMDEALSALRRVYRLEELPRSPGATAVSFGVSNGNGLRGTLGFIAPVTRPFCTQCRRLRLSATGLLRGCLMNAGGVEIAPILRGSSAGDRRAALAEALHRAILEKPWVSAMKTDVGMHTLGG